MAGKRVNALSVCNECDNKKKENTNKYINFIKSNYNYIGKKTRNVAIMLSYY